MKIDYEINITSNYAGERNIDEWGDAQAWVGDYGVEYNFCIDNGINCSAIYKATINKDGYMETDYSKFISYEINFGTPYWRDALEDAMTEALQTFYPELFRLTVADEAKNYFGYRLYVVKEGDIKPGDSIRKLREVSINIIDAAKEKVKAVKSFNEDIKVFIV